MAPLPKKLFDQPLEATIFDNDRFAFSKDGAGGDPGRNSLGTTIKAFTKGTTKVLWTGPEADVGVIRTLDGGEKFSNWDIIVVHASLISDTSPGARLSVSLFPSLGRDGDARFYSDTAQMTYNKLTDTTFEILSKSASVGNISSIIGISL